MNKKNETRTPIPGPAGLDPAAYPVEAVGTQRVALGHASMGLRVEARKDTSACWYRRQLEKYFQPVREIFFPNWRE